MPWPLHIVNMFESIPAGGLDNATDEVVPSEKQLRCPSQLGRFTRGGTSCTIVCVFAFLLFLAPSSC